MKHNNIIPPGTQLVIVMPIYNEEGSIVRVLEAWSETARQLGIATRLLALNDGSTDRTPQLVAQLAEHDDSIVQIDKPNSGHGKTCRLGYDLAAASPTEWVLQIDSDGQCDPAYFPHFWSARNEADCVFGLRTKREGAPLRHAISILCTWGARLLTGAKLPDANVPYRLMRRAVLTAALARVPPDFEIQNVALGVALSRMPNVRWRFVPIRFRERTGGTNSINLRKIATMGLRMLFALRRLR